MKKNTLSKIYFFTIILLIVITGINPKNTGAWLGEAVPVLLAAIILALTYKKFMFSLTSYTLIFSYLLFPLIGGYYTYSAIELPFKEIFQRNYLDRIVHFLSGLLLAIPLKELFVRTSKVKKYWSYIVPIAIIIAAGAIYEIAEWILVILINPQTGIAFLGAQGDIWDAQKDMLMAGIGAVLAMIISYAKNKK